MSISCACVCIACVPLPCIWESVLNHWSYVSRRETGAVWTVIKCFDSRRVVIEFRSATRHAMSQELLCSVGMWFKDMDAFQYTIPLTQASTVYNWSLINIDRGSCFYPFEAWGMSMKEDTFISYFPYFLFYFSAWLRVKTSCLSHIRCSMQIYSWN